MAVGVEEPGVGRLRLERQVGTDDHLGQHEELNEVEHVHKRGYVYCWTYQTGLSRDCSVAFTRSKSNGASFLRVSMVKRTTSGPTSSSRSRKVTKVPARLDMRTSSPFFITRTSWQSLTSSSPLPSVMALTAAFMRLT